MKRAKFIVIGISILTLLMAPSAMGQNPKPVSVNSAGTATGNDLSASPAISADGRFVAFESQASNLVANDANGKHDVFVRDLQAGTTALVSVNSAGTGSGNGDSVAPVISADGKFVAFVSSASDLLADDVNGAVQDIFVRDLQAGTTSLVSRNGAGTGSGNGQSFGPALSADAHFIAFMSDASNLVATDTNGARDIFVRDLQAGTTSLVSINSAGTGSGNGTSGNDTLAPVISPDGHRVLFESQASDLVPQDGNAFSDVFLRDLQAGTTSLASVNRFNTGGGNGQSYEPVMSDDGRSIAFTSDADDLVTNDDNGQYGHDVYVRDTVAGTTRLVSVALTGAASLYGQSFSPSISADGHLIAFASMALDLVPQQNFNTWPKIYARNLTTNKTSFVNGDAMTNYGTGSSEHPIVSRDGRFVVFVSEVALAQNDYNGYSGRDVFVRDLQAAATVLVSVSNADGFGGNSDSMFPIISDDASVIAFVSYADDIVANDHNFAADVFAVTTRAGAPQFGIINNQVNENAGTATLTVKRTFGTAGDISVHYATVSDSATSGQDYTPTSGTLLFADGETTKTIMIPIINNTLDEDDESLYVSLSSPTGGGLLGARCYARLTILDDDPLPALSINDLQLTEGNTGTTNAVFKVTLSTPSARRVGVSFATANGTAKAPGDYEAATGSLFFDPGQTSKSISVPVVGDLINEPNETFIVNLTAPSNATFAKSKGTATINNNDPLPVLSSLGLSPSNVAGGNPVYATINLTAPAPSTGAVITLSDDLAATTVPASVNLAAGARTKTVTITTRTVTTSQSGMVRASYAGVNKQAALTVRLVGVLSISLSPELLVGGSRATGVLILERAAPPGGILVSLQSNLGAATIPSSVQIPAGSFNKTFDITTGPVNTDQTATLTATANGISKSATLRIIAQAHTCASTGFGAAITTPLGDMHSALAADDFNHDGKQDLAVVNYQYDDPGTVSILLGNGSGGFSAPVNYAIGVRPVAMTTADFNRDGKRDVAVVNAYSNTVSILLGNGAGGFRAAINIPVGDGPRAVQAADFNGDGKTDLVVSNGYSHSLSTLLGDGTGGFSAPINYPFSDASSTLVPGDFNLDGKPDLVAGYGSILLGNGAGGFNNVGHVDSSVSTSSGLAVGDFNNDGKPDLAIPSYSSVVIQLGDGRGGFGSPLYFQGQGFLFDISAGDFTQDGKLDVAALDIQTGRAVLLRGNGGGGFGGLVSYPFGNGIEAHVLKDFNGDGKLDIAVSYYKNISVRLNICH